MNIYRRKKQISNEDIDQFKDVEIDKIKTLLEPSNHQKPKFNIKFANVSVFVLLMFVGLFIVFKLVNPTDSQLPPDNIVDDSYTFTQLNETTYLLEAKETDFNFNFLYGIDIVMHGERTPYDDLFEYYAPLVYASQDVIDSFDVDLNLYKYNQFNYYLEINVNDQLTYLEVNYFKKHREPMTLDLLDFDEYEGDIKQLQELLEAYPPSQVIPNVNIFEPHPDIESLEDSRAKDNYLTYVENYYTIENTYQDENDGKGTYNPELVLQRHQVIVDDTGAIAETDFLTGFGDLENSMDRFLQFNHNEFFDFYPIGAKFPENLQKVIYREDSHQVLGSFSLQKYDESRYIYSSVYLDDADEALKNSSYVTINYQLTETFNNVEGTLTEDVFFFNRAVIVPPIQVPVDIEGHISIYDLFTSVEINFYDDTDHLIHQLNITEPEI